LSGALRGCLKTVKTFQLSGQLYNIPALREHLWNTVSSNVTNYRGDFIAYWYDEDRYMHFGTQTIRVSDFVDTFLRQTGLLK
jgi:hypothetical protein